MQTAVYKNFQTEVSFYLTFINYKVYSETQKSTAIKPVTVYVTYDLSD